jgi:hypothetical protein
MVQPPLELVPENTPNSMRVAVLKKPYEIQLARAKIPEPQDNEVRIKIKYVGICGSDVENYRGERAPEFVAFPTRLGHEVAGTIDKLGKTVIGLKEGDKVVLRYVWGAFAEYIVCKPFNILKVPDEIPMLESSLIEILPGILHAAELGLGIAYLIDVVDKKILQRKFKGILTIIMIAGAIMVMIIPINSLEDFALVSTVSMIPQLGVVIVPFVFISLGLKSTGELRQTSWMIVLASIFLAVASIIVNAGIVNALNTVLAPNSIDVYLYLVQMICKIASYSLFVISSSRFKV